MPSRVRLGKAVRGDAYALIAAIIVYILVIDKQVMFLYQYPVASVTTLAGADGGTAQNDKREIKRLIYALKSVYGIHNGGY